MGGVINKWGSFIYYYITALSLFHFLRNSQYPENWSSLGNVNALGVTCQYPQIYNFSFRK